MTQPAFEITFIYDLFMDLYGPETVTSLKWKVDIHLNDIINLKISPQVIPQLLDEFPLSMS